MIKIVSTPKVAVAYGEKAIIKDGKKQPYQTTSQNGTQTQFVEAVLSLEVTPTITPSCDVVMDLKITNDSVGAGSPPPINQKSAETKLTVKSGETAVIGGTYVNSETDTDEGIPYLMDIPLFGKLFKSKASTKNNRELLVFITPKLLNTSCKDSEVMNLKYEKLECSAF
jgi:type IV pilus assembly protein PilQ